MSPCWASVGPPRVRSIDINHEDIDRSAVVTGMTGWSEEDRRSDKRAPMSALVKRCVCRRLSEGYA